MTSYLLDTHAFIWWLENSKQLSPHARGLIANPNANVYVSHASLWEIAIKQSIGRLEFPVELLDSLLDDNGFELLTIKTAHIIQSSTLPLHHRDPFDRLLIAQAQIESFGLISKDSHFPDYDIDLYW